MVYTTHLLWFGGGFIIAIPTLVCFIGFKSQRFDHLSPEFENENFRKWMWEAVWSDGFSHTIDSMSDGSRKLRRSLSVEIQRHFFAKSLQGCCETVQAIHGWNSWIQMGFWLQKIFQTQRLTRIIWPNWQLRASAKVFLTADSLWSVASRPAARLNLGLKADRRAAPVNFSIEIWF